MVGKGKHGDVQFCIRVTDASADIIEVVDAAADALHAHHVDKEPLCRFEIRDRKTRMVDASDHSRV